jgi:hypothetical protein
VQDSAACACGRTLRHPRRALFSVAGAGALANGVTNFLYLLQILLSVYLLLDRRRPSASRCSLGGSGDGQYCTGQEFAEPPIMPLRARPPTVLDPIAGAVAAAASSSAANGTVGSQLPLSDSGDEGGLEVSLLRGGVGSSRPPPPLAVVKQQWASGSGQQLLLPTATPPHPIPLRFWVAWGMSTLVVCYLATSGCFYGIFLTDRLRSWAEATSGSIGAAQALVQALPAEDPSVSYLLSLLDWAQSGVQTVLQNFGAVRPALFGGMALGLLNEACWKLAAWR